VTRPRQVAKRGKGPPIYTYRAVPGVPPVSARRLGKNDEEPPLPRGPHIHDFIVLAYFEQSGGSLEIGHREWSVEAGDLYLVAPGEVVTAGDPSPLDSSEGWGVFFTPDIFGPQAPGAFLSWRAHPMLYPFARGTSRSVHRLRVPPGQRTSWSERLQTLHRELRQRRSGYRDAAQAHLTLLLVDIARLADDIVRDLKLQEEPLLARVFAFIDERYHTAISLRDVALEVNLSAGYLTTIVRQKTGRTVQEWITERRMAEARRLLIDTDLAVEEVGISVGYGDPGYFIRLFRRDHDTTPLRWRHAGRI
jgi:AraC family transcriptional regulator, transcriptional activator of pobA